MATRQITPSVTVSGNQPRVKRLPEGATQTFKIGVPLMLSSGALVIWDGTTFLAGIAGVSMDFGNSLASAGVALQKSYGDVPFQASAKNLLRPYFNDGKVGLAVANLDTEFAAQVGPSQNLTGVNVGGLYGLTADSDGHWYVDTTKTTSSGGGRNTAVEIVGFDDWDTGRGVRFKFQSDVIAGL